MSQGTQQTPSKEQLADTSTNNPAVGLVATADNADWIAGEILHVHQNGYQTVVTSTTDADLKAIQYARILDAEVIEPPRSWTDAKKPKQRLREYTKEAGYPGLIYHPQGPERIDIETSYGSLKTSDRFAVHAKLQPTVDQEPSVLVGIPAYDEADTIGSVVESASQHADTVLVVDDGSSDATVEVAEEAGATVVEHQTNSGYGAALNSIFKQANRAETDHLVILDADGQHDASDIPKLIRRQRETDADIVIGCRFGENTETEMPVYRRFGLGVVNVLTNLSLGIVRPRKRVRDTQSGFRAYSNSAIRSLDEDSALGVQMDASTNILYHAHARDYEIEEVPTTIDYDIEDHSTQSPIQHGMTLVWNILRTVERERPITMVGVPGLLCTLIGTGFGYRTVLAYVQTGAFPIGLAMAATSFSMIGVFATFTAIILHSLEVYRD